MPFVSAVWICAGFWIVRLPEAASKMTNCAGTTAPLDRAGAETKPPKLIFRMEPASMLIVPVGVA